MSWMILNIVVAFWNASPFWEILTNTFKLPQKKTNLIESIKLLEVESKPDVSKTSSSISIELVFSSIASPNTTIDVPSGIYWSTIVVLRATRFDPSGHWYWLSYLIHDKSKLSYWFICKRLTDSSPLSECCPSTGDWCPDHERSVRSRNICRSATTSDSSWRRILRPAAVYSGCNIPECWIGRVALFVYFYNPW